MTPDATIKPVHEALEKVAKTQHTHEQANRFELTPYTGIHH